MAKYAQSIQFLLSQARRAAGSLEDGTVTAYAAGTSTLKTIWLDRGKQTEAANPYTLDANGTAQLFADGLYRIVIKTASGAVVYDRPDLSFKDVSNLAYDVADYASLAAAVVAIGSSKATLQYAADQTISSNLNIPANIELMPLNGAVINHGAYTITYAGDVSRWPLLQIFNGSGAVTGLAEAKPEWFSNNAVPRTTDMTSAVRSAFGAAPVVKLSNWYKTTSEIVVSSTVTVEGIGQGKCGIYAALLGANKSALKFTSDSIHLRDLTIEGPAGGVYVADEIGVYLYGTSGAVKENATVTRVEIKNFGSYGLLAEYYDAVAVNDCYFHHIGYGAIMGFSAQNFKVIGNTIDSVTPGTAGDAYGVSATGRSNEAVSTGFVFDANIVRNVPGWEAFDTHGGSNGVISNNVVTDCRIGINVSPSNGGNVPPHDIVISGNTISRGTAPTSHDGIIVGGWDASNKAYNISVSNNILKSMGFASNQRGAIFVQSTDMVDLIGNKIYDSVSNAIFLNDTNTNINIVGNSIVSIQAGLTSVAGIGIYAATNTGAISSNRISTGSFPAVQVWNTAANVTFYSNSIVSSASPQIVGGAYLGSGASFTGTVVSDVASIPAYTSVNFTIPVVNSAQGDMVNITVQNAGSNVGSQYLTMTGVVDTAGVVVCTLFNPKATAVDPPAGATWRAVTVRP